MKTKVYRNIILFMSMVCVLTSCYEDLGNYDYHAINEVEIDSLGIEFNVIQYDTLRITPQLNQTIHDNDPLSYEWEIDYQVVSTEKNLIYPVESVKGGVPIRFRTTNMTTGVTYFQHSVLNALSYYSAGLSVLQEDNDNYSVSFIRMAPDNPGFVVDSIFKRNGFDLGHGHSVTSSFTYDTQGTGYYMVCDSGFNGEKRVTMFDLNMTQINQYKEAFVPKNVYALGANEQIVIGDDNGVNRIYVMGSNELYDNGTPYEVSPYLCPVPQIPNPLVGPKGGMYNCFLYMMKFDQASMLTIATQMSSTIIGPIYGSYIRLEPGTDLVVAGNVNSEYQQALVASEDLQDAGIVKVISSLLYVYPDGYVTIPRGTFKTDSKFCMNAKEMLLFYTDENGIAKGSFNNSWQSEPFFELLPGQEITCMYATTANDVLYVGVYEADAEQERKGSLYVVNQGDGSIVDKYEYRMDRIVDLSYKKYNQNQEPKYQVIQ